VNGGRFGHGAGCPWHGSSGPAGRLVGVGAVLQAAARPAGARGARGRRIPALPPPLRRSGGLSGRHPSGARRPAPARPTSYVAPHARPPPRLPARPPHGPPRPPPRAATAAAAARARPRSRRARAPARPGPSWRPCCCGWGVEVWDFGGGGCSQTGVEDKGCGLGRAAAVAPALGSHALSAPTPRLHTPPTWRPPWRSRPRAPPAPPRCRRAPTTRARGRAGRRRLRAGAGWGGVGRGGGNEGQSGAALGAADSIACRPKTQTHLLSNLAPTPAEDQSPLTKKGVVRKEVCALRHGGGAAAALAAVLFAAAAAARRRLRLQLGDNAGGLLVRQVGGGLAAGPVGGGGQGRAAGLRVLVGLRLRVGFGLRNLRRQRQQGSKAAADLPVERAAGKAALPLKAYPAPPLTLTCSP
jgi:hypothetical protein